MWDALVGPLIHVADGFLGQIVGRAAEVPQRGGAGTGLADDLVDPIVSIIHQIVQYANLPCLCGAVLLSADRKFPKGLRVKEKRQPF